MNLVNSTSEFEYDGLIADASIPVLKAAVSLESGQGVLLRGSVLGKAADGKVVLVGGTRVATAEYILADDIDTGTVVGTPISVITYASGAFNRFALIIDGAGKIDEHEADLKKFGLYLKAVL